MMRRVLGAGEVKPGRVIVGPKKVGEVYARIVSEKDGSGRIESYDVASRTWEPAPENVTFSDVWSAPAVPFNMLPQNADPEQREA